MECFPNFCLGCDNQAPDGFYCSEACRMSDVERSGSLPASPNQTHHTTTLYQFIFPANFNDAATTHNDSPAYSTTGTGTSGLPQHGHSKSADGQPRRRLLSPSSSRSSLISTASIPETSEQTAKELSSYFNAFDRTRDQRRKSLPAFKHMVNLSTTIAAHSTTNGPKTSNTNQ